MCLCVLLCGVYQVLELSLAPQRHPMLPCQLWGLRSWVRQRQERLVSFHSQDKSRCCRRVKLCLRKRANISKVLPGGERSVGWVCYVCVRSTAGQLTVTEGWPGVSMRALSRFQTTTGKRRPPPPGFTLEPWEALSVLFINLHLDGYFFSSPSAFPLINHSGIPSRSLHYSIKMDVERKQDKMPLL